MLTASGMARLAPAAFAPAMARSSAGLWPEITTWPGELSLATCTISPPVLASAQTFSSVGISNPRIAAMPPGLSSPARFISSPRLRTRRSPSAKGMPPAAQMAESSPSECPARITGEKPRPKLSKARYTAREWMKSAGWVLSVSFSSVSGPSHMILERSNPRIWLDSSKTSRADSNCAARSRPMPVACEPWPGNIKAVVWGFKVMVHLRA